MSKRAQLLRIESLLNRLDSAVVVRDPGNTRSAEAYDGLRKQITQSGKNHRTHMAHLLSLSDSLERGADIDLIRDRVNDFMNEIGLQRTTDTSMEHVFEIVEGEGSGLECIEPAVIELLDGGTYAPVRLGKARRIKGPEPEVTVEHGIDEIRSKTTNGASSSTHFTHKLIWDKAQATSDLVKKWSAIFTIFIKGFKFSGGLMPSFVPSNASQYWYFIPTLSHESAHRLANDSDTSCPFSLIIYALSTFTL